MSNPPPQGPQDPETFDINTDAYYSLIPCEIMSGELLDFYRAGNYDAIARIKAEEQAHIKATSDLIASNEGHAFTQVKLANGEQILMAWTEGTNAATTYIRVMPNSIQKSANGKAECTAQIASISASTNTGSATTMPIKNLDLKLLTGGELLVASAIAAWFSSIVKAGLTDALEQMTYRLANALMQRELIQPTTQMWLVENAAPIVGRLGARLIGGGLGFVIGGVVVYGAVEIFKYTFLNQYTLVCKVYNFDAVHDWEIQPLFYGSNERLVDPPSDGAIPRCVPAGQVLVPGMNVASDVKSAAVYFKAFSFQCARTSAGGFTVAGAVERGNITGETDVLTVNWAYCIEKLADNSMALRVGEGQDAKEYYLKTLHDGDDMAKTKLLTTPIPVSTTMTSPELFNADDDIYSCRVDIGTAPTDWHAVGA